MDTRGYIDVTDLDLRKLVSLAFDRSSPQGLGFLQHKPGPITEAEIDAVLHPFMEEDYAAYADYLRGRSMKLWIERGDDGRLYWWPGWTDHANSDMIAILRELGVENAEAVYATALVEIEERNADGLDE